MTSLDGESGYDHILLNPNSRQYFGIQFAGTRLKLATNF